jgi:tRNA nucleotidyltransferase (CCA-adding enzyme)
VPQNKSKIKSGRAILASLKREMAEPRMARSARIEQLKLEKAQTREQPSTTMPGTVDKIIPAPSPGQPEKAQIAVDRTDRPHRDFRIENALTDEHGDDVKLKKSAHVEITVTAKDIKP